jgi:hypothetical protein
MERRRVVAVALALNAAAPAAAAPPEPIHPGNVPLMSRLAEDVPMHLEHKGFSFPVVEYVEPTGTRRLRRGIIAGKTVAPDTIIGVGVFRSSPKSGRTIGEPPPASTLRRSGRSAAIGLSMKF